MKKHIIFIINPISGKGKGRFIESDIVDFFKDKPYRIEIIFAEYAGHAKEIVQDKINESPDIIVACGGDGTINEIAQGLIGSHVKLGIVPIGSGNGLASNLRQYEPTHIMENIIYNELLKMGYNVDVGVVIVDEKGKNGVERKRLEVDFIINDNEERYYIQIAYSLSKDGKVDQELNSLKNIKDNFKKIIR